MVASIKSGMKPIFWIRVLCTLWGCTERSSATGQKETSSAGVELLGTWETEGIGAYADRGRRTFNFDHLYGNW